MAVVLVTGMSGAGKSMALAELAQRGHQVVDTDDGDWIEDVPLGRGLESERLWREDKINALISEHVANTLCQGECGQQRSSPTPARSNPCCGPAPLLRSIPLKCSLTRWLMSWSASQEWRPRTAPLCGWAKTDQRASASASSTARGRCFASQARTSANRCAAALYWGRSSVSEMAAAICIAVDFLLSRTPAPRRSTRTVLSF